MYSYEDRIRAVTLYIKLGKRTGATIRQLGYPTKNSLKSWHEEYERRLDLSSGYVRSKPKYSQVQKEQAVKHYAEHGRCIASTVEALGYPRDWKGTTIEQFIEVVDSYIRWYNEKRIKISLGALSPIEYRVSLGLAA